MPTKQNDHPIFDRPTKAFAAVSCRGIDVRTQGRIFHISKPKNIWWGDAAKDSANILNAPLIPELVAICKEALEALFNLAPQYRESGCFNELTVYEGSKPCPCTACRLKAIIAKVEQL